MKICKFKSALFILIVFFYVILVTSYGVWSYHSCKKALIERSDKQLLFAAINIKNILPKKFHDKAVEKSSISEAENIKIGRKLSEYIKTTNIIYVYTLISKNGNLYFTSSSNTPEEAQRGEITKYFEPYPEASNSTINAFNKKEPTYNIDTDRWGTFRSILIPYRSKNGNSYLAGADINLEMINAQLDHMFWKSLIISSVFILLIIPFILAKLCSKRERIEEFENLKDLLHHKSMERTIRIEKKIDEYIEK